MPVYGHTNRIGSMETATFKFKVALLGEGGVGKTSLVRRYVLNEFDDKYLVTIGAKTSSKVVRLETEQGQEIECHLQVWDVMGQRHFKNLQKNFVKGAQGGIIVSDLTRPDTMKDTENWSEMLFGVTGPIPLVYAVNKCDLLKGSPFKKETLDDILASNKGLIFATSAKTGENVEAMFFRIAQLLCENALGTKITEPTPPSA